MRVKQIWFLLLLILPVSSINVGAAKSVQEMVKKEMLVSVGWLAAKTDNPDLTVLHIGKDQKSYNAGHISGAQFVSWNDIAVTKEGLPNQLPSDEEITALIQRLGIDDTKTVILYGDDEGKNAARAYFVLDYSGLGDRAAILDGQLNRWKYENKPLSKEMPNIIPSAYVPKFRPQTVIRMNRVSELVRLQAMLPDTPISIVDVRSEKEFKGEKAGEGIKRAGHIPGARSVPWSGNIETIKNPALESSGDLTALYMKSGIESFDRIVVYSGAGGESALTYFVLKYLGHDVHLYEGSFIEWSRAKDNQIEKGPAQARVRNRLASRPAAPNQKAVVKTDKPASIKTTQPGKKPR
jgi:thiosulfate/3-mercaptopyruvate sulfurtransferase